jgi:transposase
MLELGSHTMQDWEKLLKETGSLSNRPLNRRPRKIDRQELLGYYREYPLALDIEVAKHFNCTAQSIRAACKSIGITRKKTKSYRERDESERAEFVEILMNLPEDAELFYADESGFEEEYSKEYGHAPADEEVHGSVSGVPHDRTNVVAAYKSDPRNSWLILDNARFHNRDRLFSIAETHGFNLLFLPRYSPDFNPIEHVRANIKSWLRLYSQHFANFCDAFQYAFHSA